MNTFLEKVTMLGRPADANPGVTHRTGRGQQFVEGLTAGREQHRRLGHVEDSTLGGPAQGAAHRGGIRRVTYGSRLGTI